jgi:Sulfatase-modifying factor enzyme 1
MASPSRLLLAAFPTALFAVALGAGASCGSTVDNYPALDGGLGAGSTVTGTSTGGTGGTSSSSSSSSSSSGTGGGTTTNTCAGATKCSTATDCPALGTDCLVNSCQSGCCSVTKAAASTTCADNGGKLCDGSGHCVACVTASQCSAPTSSCATAACTANACTTTNATKGVSCADGGMTCDGNGNCVDAACTDGIKDGLETDVDCGGPVCQPCADNKMCQIGTDCADKVCTGAGSGVEGTCSAPSCSDGVQNGQETDVDCGGPTCTPCTNGEACLKNTDCASGSCMGKLCVAASCSDGILDGTETDFDCGGASCPPCTDGMKCGAGANAGNNCVNKVCGAGDAGSCATGTCCPPSCTDGKQNGNETDVDCGGTSYMGQPACSACNPGQKCIAPNDCAGKNCQAGVCQCPQGMLVIPIQGSGIYCIDAVEVTNAEYDTFLTANPTTAGQPSYCSWNVGWTPHGGWPYPVPNGNYPVAYVNWCQASAYCNYEGRRLCGMIGGGSATATIANDYTKDQWFNACTANGVNCSGGGCYPYGTAYNPTTCNGVSSVDGGSMGPADFNTLINCQGGSVGLLNMSGNVSEWEDSCATSSGSPQTDSCAVRGGSYLGDATALRCDAVQTQGANGTITRGYYGPDVGFRCCL